jgi:ring-1,2-phenylacetyl-CoA epoxidase subunit PaaA
MPETTNGGATVIESDGRLAAVVPLCEACEIRGPAHHDEDAAKFVLDYPLPVAYDPERKRWDFDKAISWDEVFARWKQRGPYNETYVGTFQKHYRQFAKLLNGKA